MKKREEMIRDLHRQMDEYEFNKRMKRAKTAKVAAVVTPVCAAAVVGVGLWQGGAFSSDNAKMSGSNTIIITGEQNTTAVNPAAEVITTEGATKNTESITTEIRTTEAATTQLEEIVTQAQPTEATEAQTVLEQQKITEASGYSQGTIADMIAMKSVNGIVYQQFFSEEDYTCGEYIGESSTFIGFPEEGSIYFSNESPDVIIIKFTAGGQVTLKKTDISPEQYQQEYEQIKEMMNNGIIF
jgi:hypothetical protein